MLLLYLAASEDIAEKGRSLTKEEVLSEEVQVYGSRARPFTQQLGSLPDTPIKTAPASGAISAAPQGNNITHLNVAPIESFPALMIHLNKSAFFILPS